MILLGLRTVMAGVVNRAVYYPFSNLFVVFDA